MSRVVLTASILNVAILVILAKSLLGVSGKNKGKWTARMVLYEQI